MIHPSMSATAFANLTFAMLLTSASITGSGGAYIGVVKDKRVAECGIIVTQDDTIRVEPFLVGGDDLEGRLTLNVQKAGAFGASQSNQVSIFANGTLGRIISSFERSSDLTVEMLITDLTGNILCELRRSKIFGSAATKI